MDWLVRKNLYIYYTLFHTLGYYVLLYFWQNNEAVTTTGETLFSLAAPLTSSSILLFIYRRQKTKEKYLWLFLSLGCFFNFMAVLAGRCFSQKELLYLKWTNFFYILQIACFLIASISKIRMNEYRHLIKFTFDTSIIMTAAITFSWHFTMSALLTRTIFIGYPIGDLILFFGAMIFYLGSETLSPTRNGDIPVNCFK